MLIKCPECDLQVSDKALSCPHCGYPLKPEATKPRRPRTNKRKRLPNGFGQISELKGQSLRKPFRAMVTVGKTPEGRPICKLLKPVSYFATYNEAYTALMEYNRSPFDFDANTTVTELYNIWSVEYYTSLKDPAAYRAAWRYCESIHDMKLYQVKPSHVKYCIEEAMITEQDGTHTASANTKVKIRGLLKRLFDRALELNLVTVSPVEPVKVKQNPQTKTSHKAFSDEEMAILWDEYKKVKYSDMILIQCYSGWRPRELVGLKMSDVDMKQKSMTGGMKTAYGENRTVPIHPKIYKLVKAYYDSAKEVGSDYLFNRIKRAPTGEIEYMPMTYKSLQVAYDKAIRKMGLDENHRPHDGRKKFITMAKKYKLDEYAIKRLAGHSIADLTERVYTERDFEWLKEEMEKIK